VESAAACLVAAFASGVCGLVAVLVGFFTPFLGVAEFVAGLGMGCAVASVWFAWRAARG
jgi:hypothetical protein